jgi:hypothetical protein
VGLQLVSHPKGQTCNAADEDLTTVTIYIAFFLGSDAVYSGRYFSGNPSSILYVNISEVVSPRDGQNRCRLKDNMNVDIHDTRSGL